MKEKYWFRAKYYEWGWYPSTWQGWAVLAIWCLLFGEILFKIDKYSHSVSDTLIGFFIPLVLLVALLLFICYGTGEKPRWSWGRR